MCNSRTGPLQGQPSRGSLAGLDRSQVRGWAASVGEPAFRGDQIFHWIHAMGVTDPSAMTNLPPALRERLAQTGAAALPAEAARVVADDGTVKVAFALEDGYVIESVIIPQDDSEDGPATGRATLCVSTQVGCGVRCRFCRSGREGFRRNLAPAEILAQVIGARRIAAGSGDRVNRVVFMGMGEPLDNLEAVETAIRILVDKRGEAFPQRKIVISTIGRPDGIRRLGDLFGGRLGLAVSVHAVDPAVRARLMGPGHESDLESILNAMRDYPLPPRDRITVEIVLVAGVNDSARQAAALASALHGIRARVNLIPLNAFEGVGLEPPSGQAVAAFRQILLDRGIDVLLRRRRGAQVLASCGQLAFGRAH